MEAAFGLQDCGDDVLLQIMSHLSIKQRCSLACVDRRLRGLAAAPSLLRSLDVELDGSVQELSSFFGWLAAVAAPHVDELSLAIDREDEEREGSDYDELDGFFDGIFGDDVLDALQAGLGTLGAAAHQLTTLRLKLWADFTLSSAQCAVLPPSLQRLEVTCCSASDAEAELTVAHGLKPLPALEHLALTAGTLRFVGLPQLTFPPALTSLTLCAHEGMESAQLPQAITLLSALRRLSLQDVGRPAELARLTHLRALEQLHLVDCEVLPACLGELPALRAVQLQVVHGLASGTVLPRRGEALVTRALVPVASRLTHLSLLEDHLPMPECLPEMARLERLCCHVSLSHSLSLPPGPWLRSLRQAALPARVAAASLGALSAATRLEALALFSCSGGGAAAALEVAAWAAQRSGLRTLELWPVGLLLRSSPAYAWRELGAGLARLQLPPTLKVLRGNELARELALLSDALPALPCLAYGCMPRPVIVIQRSWGRDMGTGRQAAVVQTTGTGCGAIAGSVLLRPPRSAGLHGACVMPSCAS